MDVFDRNEKFAATLVKREGAASDRQRVSDTFDGLVERLLKQGIMLTDEGITVFHHLETAVYTDADFTLSRNWITLWEYVKDQLTEGKHYVVYPELDLKKNLSDLEAQETQSVEGKQRARDLHAKAAASEIIPIATRWFEETERVLGRRFTKADKRRCIEWVDEHGSLVDPKTWDKLRRRCLAQK